MKLEDVERYVADYLGTTLAGRADKTDSVFAWSVTFPNSVKVFAKQVETRPLTTLQKPYSSAVRERSIAQRVARLGGNTPRLILPGPSRKMPILSSDPETTSGSHFVLYEWIDDLRHVRPLSKDVENTLAAYAQTSVAVELAGRGIGPWQTFPNNGPQFWRTIPTTAVLMGRSGNWIEAIAEHADGIGALEMMLPLDVTRPNAILRLDDVLAVSRNLYNMEIRESDEAALVLDMQQIKPTSNRTRELSVMNWAGRIIGDSDAELIVEEVRRQTLREYEHLAPVPDVNAQAMRAGRKLLELRGAAERLTFNDSVSANEGIRVLDMIKDLQELAPDAFKPGFPLMKPSLAIDFG